MKPDDHHLNHSHHHHLKSDDQLSYTTTSGGNSSTPSVSSPPSSHPLNSHTTSDFNSNNGLVNHPAQGLPAPTAQDPVTSQILHNLLEQQMLVQHQSQPSQQLIGNLVQVSAC
jgi:hypothetical protein